MTIPSNWKEQMESPQIILNSGSSYSTKAQTTNTILNTVFEALLSAGTAAVVGKLGGAGGAEGSAGNIENLSQADQAKLAYQQGIMDICAKNDLAGINAQITKITQDIANIDAQITELQGYQNLESLQAYKENESIISKFETQYGSEASGDDAKNVKAYQEAKTAWQNAFDTKTKQDNQILALESQVGKNNEPGSISKEISALQTNIENEEAIIKNIKALPENEQTEEYNRNRKFLAEKNISNFKQQKLAKEQEQTTKQAELNKLKQTLITQKDVDALKTKMDSLANGKVGDTNAKEVYSKYEEALAKRDDFKTKSRTAQTKINQLTNERTALENSRLLYQDAYNAESAGTNAVSERKGDMKEASDRYIQANKKDGNWFSRNWQKAKGIFSKSERKEYKQMRDAHKDKKEALSEYKALGGTRSEIKSAEYNYNELQLQTRVNTFMDSHKTYDRSKVESYVRKYPNASNKDIESNCKPEAKEEKQPQQNNDIQYDNIYDKVPQQNNGRLFA